MSLSLKALNGQSHILYFLQWDREFLKEGNASYKSAGMNQKCFLLNYFLKLPK